MWYVYPKRQQVQGLAHLQPRVFPFGRVGIILARYEKVKLLYSTVPNYVTTESELPAPLACATAVAAASAWRASSGLLSIHVEMSSDILRL